MSTTIPEIAALQARLDDILQGSKITTVLEVLGVSLAKALVMYGQNGADPVEELLNLKHRIYITMRQELAAQLERKLMLQEARPGLILPS